MKLFHPLEKTAHVYLIAYIIEKLTLSKYVYSVIWRFKSNEIHENKHKKWQIRRNTGFF